jgi:hypothetical protein
MNTQLLTHTELTKLQLEVSACSEREADCLAKVPLPLLKTILLNLDKHIDEGLQINVVQRGLDVFAVDGSQGLEKWVHTGEGRHLLQKLHDAVKAAVTLLMFLTARGLEPTLLGEERIENCCGLLKSILQGTLAKIFKLASGGGEAVKAMLAKSTGGKKGNTNATRGLRGGGGKRGRRGRSEHKSDAAASDDYDRGGGCGCSGGSGGDDDNFDDDDAAVEEEDFGDEDDDLEERGLPTREAARPLAKAVMALCVNGDVLPFMELLEVLVGCVRLDDRLLLALTGTCLSTLPVQCEVIDIPRFVPLQRMSLGLLQSIFALYEHHRYPMVDDLFGIVLNLPTGKRHLRTHKLHHFSRILSVAVAGGTAVEDCAPLDSIQSMSALVMLLVQSCVYYNSSAAEGSSLSLSRTSGGGSSATVAQSPPTRSMGDLVRSLYFNNESSSPFWCGNCCSGARGRRRAPSIANF